MRIYAADDETFMLDALTDSIRKALPEAEVEGFKRAVDVIDAMKKAPCDVAFLDVQMMAMDGLTLARTLQAMKKNVNIVFVTGYNEYKADAMDIYASDYIIKPVNVGSILKAMQNLRHPIPLDIHSYRVITFGNFALYVDGKPVNFHRKKSAELLAYLVARQGTVVSRAELTMILYEDSNHSMQSRKKLDNTIRTLRDDLNAVGAGEILYKGTDGLAVNKDLLEADLFDYFKSNDQIYPGQFLEQYSWSELFKGDFV